MDHTWTDCCCPTISWANTHRWTIWPKIIIKRCFLYLWIIMTIYIYYKQNKYFRLGSTYLASMALISLLKPCVLTVHHIFIQTLWLRWFIYLFFRTHCTDSGHHTESLIGAVKYVYRICKKKNVSLLLWQIFSRWILKCFEYTQDSYRWLLIVQYLNRKPFQFPGKLPPQVWSNYVGKPCMCWPGIARRIENWNLSETSVHFRFPRDITL